MNSCRKSLPNFGDSCLRIVVTGAVLSAANVYAETVFDRQAYIGAGFGTSSFALQDSAGVELSLTDNYSSAGHFVLGRDFSPRLTGEFQYNDLGKASLDVQSSVTYKDIAVSGLIYLYGANQNRQGLAAYTRLGIGQIETEGSISVKRDHAVHLVAGAGIEYSTPSGIGFRADYTYHDEDVNAASLSLLYRFGSSRQNIAEAPLSVEEEYSEPTTAPKIAELPQGPQVAQQAEPVPPTPIRTPDPVQTSAPEPKPVQNITPEPIKQLPTPPQSSTGTSVAWSEQAGYGTSPTYSAAPFMAGPAIENLTFLTGSNELTGVTIGVLEGVVEQMQEDPTLTLEIGSHTDDRGSEANNLALSKKRAVAVARYIYSWGIDVNRVRAMAYAGRRPIASNATAEGRRKNRRVELNFVN